VFPSNFEAGTYNATRSLLVAWDNGTSYCPYDEGRACRHVLREQLADGRHPLNLYQYGWRQQPKDKHDADTDANAVDYDAPAVRLLALGRDQYWPVAVLGPFAGAKQPTLLPRAPGQLLGSSEYILIPNSWRVVQMAGLALAVFFCWSLWRSSIFSTLQPIARFAPAVRDRRCSLILIAGFTLIFILLILMWPAMHGARDSGLGLEPLLLAGLLAVFSVTLLEASVRSFAPEQPPSKNVHTAADEHQTGTPIPAPLPSTEVSTVPSSVGYSSPTGAAVALRADVLPTERIDQQLSVEPTDESCVGRLEPAKARANWSRVKSTVSSVRYFLSRSKFLLLFVVATAALLYGVGRGEPLTENSALVRWYATVRTVQLTSGLSFIMPTFFFLTVWLWWAEHLSSGYALLDQRRPRMPKGISEELAQSLSPEAFPELLASIGKGRHSFLRYLGIAAFVLISVAFLMGVRHPVTSLEKPLPLEAAMTILLLLSITGVISATLRTWNIWVGVRKMLVHLDMSPLRGGFKTIGGFSWKPIWRFGAGSLPEFLRIFSRNREAMEYALRTCPDINAHDTVESYKATLNAVKAAKDETQMRYPYSWDWHKRRIAERNVLEQFGKYQENVAAVAGDALNVLAKRWKVKKEEKRQSALEAIVPYLTRDTAAVADHELSEAEDLQFRACERFVCMSYVNVLLVMLVRIRTLIVTISGMYVLTLIGISQYPYEPKGVLQLLLVALLVFVISVVGLVFAQIHRDTVLSNITDTKPGELGIDFYFRMASFIALPLLSLLASQFPSVNQFFYSWLQPAFEALNR
jgi:hypothetical protein